MGNKQMERKNWSETKKNWKIALTKKILKSFLYLYQYRCIDVAAYLNMKLHQRINVQYYCIAYSYINVLGCLCIYVQYVSAKIYVLMYQNQSYFNRQRMQEQNVSSELNMCIYSMYDWTEYTYMLVLACTWAMGVRQVFVQCFCKEMLKNVFYTLLAEPHWQIEQLKLLFQIAMFFAEI